MEMEVRKRGESRLCYLGLFAIVVTELQVQPNRRVDDQRYRVRVRAA
jgi:hypothetical protein